MLPEAGAVAFSAFISETPALNMVDMVRAKRALAPVRRMGPISGDFSITRLMPWRNLRLRLRTKRKT